MNSNDFISIRPARGGFVIEYQEYSKATETASSFAFIVTEVVANEAKLIKRIREVLASYNGPVTLQE